MIIKQKLTGMAAKALLVLVLTVAFTFSAPLLHNTENNSVAAAGGTVKVCQTTTGVLLENDSKIYCNSCNINGNNYFKLRDVACLLNGTSSEFDISWNAARKAIFINTNRSYPNACNALAGTRSCKITYAQPVNTKIYLDGKAVTLNAYNIGGNTYFKLRDLAPKVGFGVGWNNKAQTIDITAQTGISEQTPSALATQAEQVLYYTNLERTKNGLSKLSAMSSLDAAAAKRAQEIVKTFAHTRPNGSQCFTVLAEYDVSYRTAGENIAMGQPNAKSVVEAWMNSPGHKANILNSSFTKLGVGVYQSANGTMYWSQMFIGN
ncbi:MAG: CAP domain-containing protein [Clostridia bacterium]|nr:CAP domain-containing protein [Clostridia bacterium]MDD4571483.1 CAP domain-containing protein [Clostridia bacterium]